jgi:hypothetical protein
MATTGTVKDMQRQGIKGWWNNQPTLQIHINLGFFVMNTETMHRDVLRCQFVYDRLYVRLLHWEWDMAFVRPQERSFRMEVKEFRYTIDQVRAALDRAGETGNLALFRKEFDFARTLLEQAAQRYPVKLGK